MALRELTQTSPTIAINKDGRVQTRQFYGLEADIPDYGDDMSGVGSFPAGYRARSVQSSRDMSDETGEDHWLITIQAGPDFYESELNSNLADELPRYGFRVSLGTGNVTVGTSGIEKDAAAVTVGDTDENEWKYRYPTTQVVFFVKKQYKDDLFLATVNDVVSKLGKVNSANDDPFPGAVAKEWRLAEPPMNWVNTDIVEVEWRYEHAGTDHTGAIQTWEDKWRSEYGWDMPSGVLGTIGDGFNW